MNNYECVCGSLPDNPDDECRWCQLIGQRDALLAACKETLADLSDMNNAWFMRDVVGKSRARLLAAVASVEGDNP